MLGRAGAPGSKADVVSALKAEMQGPADRLRLRNAFVVAQIAFSIPLVIAAGLLGPPPTGPRHGSRIRSRAASARVDRSVARRLHGATAGVRATLLQRVRAARRAIGGDRDGTPRPGVVGGMLGDTITVPGMTPTTGDPAFMASWTIVEPGYFATLRIPLAAGRDFTAADRSGEPSVIIVPEAAARRLWPGQNAVGKTVVYQTGRRNGPGGPPLPPVSLQVVGVAKDLKSDGPRGPTSMVQAYAPLQQRYTPRLTIMARDAGARRTAADIRGVVQSLDANLPILSARTLEDEITGPVQTQLRVAASVSGSVGIVSLLLAAIGIYGVTAYLVGRRTREIGIRLALGAHRGQILGMILRQGMALVAIGSAIGLLLGAAGSRFLTRLLFGVPPLDPLTFGGAALLFAAIGLAACYVPARRATGIDAMDALRCQ